MRKEISNTVRENVFKVNNCSKCVWKERCDWDSYNRNGNVISCDGFYPSDISHYTEEVKQMIREIESEDFCDVEYDTESTGVEDKIRKAIASFNSREIVFLEDVEDLFKLVGYIKDLCLYIDYDKFTETFYISK